MATTITPGIGAGVLFTQQGVGTSPGYAGIDLRRSDSLALQEGVYGASDFMVVQHAAGANMSVDIGMPAGGFALVQGDSVAGQGLYTIPVHASTVTETVAAADATNPRVDSAILEVLDNVHDASGSSLARVRVLTGTPFAGTTLTSRSGAPTLPSSALLLADILVGAGVTSVDNTKIRDRRKFARGAQFEVTVTSGALLSTASTTMQEINASLSKRIELSGVDLLWIFRCQTVNTIATSNDAGPWVDGAVYAVANGGGKAGYGTAVGGVAGTVMATHLVRGIAAGSHLVSAGGNSGSGSGTATFTGDATRPASLTVQEIVRQNTANNSVTSG